MTDVDAVVVAPRASFKKNFLLLLVPRLAETLRDEATVNKREFNLVLQLSPGGYL